MHNIKEKLLLNVSACQHCTGPGNGFLLIHSLFLQNRTLTKLYDMLDTSFR